MLCLCYKIWPYSKFFLLFKFPDVQLSPAVLRSCMVFLSFPVFPSCPACLLLYPSAVAEMSPPGSPPSPQHPYRHHFIPPVAALCQCCGAACLQFALLRALRFWCNRPLFQLCNNMPANGLDKMLFFLIRYSSRVLSCISSYLVSATRAGRIIRPWAAGHLRTVPGARGHLLALPPCFQRASPGLPERQNDAGACRRLLFSGFGLAGPSFHRPSLPIFGGKSRRRGSRPIVPSG